MSLERATINHLSGYRSNEADVSLRLSQETLRKILLKQLDVAQARTSGLLTIDGAAQKLVELFSLLDEVPATFPIVTPRVSP